MLKRITLWLAVWWLWIPAVFGILWLITHALFGGFGVATETWNLFWQNNILNHGGILWVYLIIGAIGSLIIIGMVAVDEDSDSGNGSVVITVVLALALLIVSTVAGINYQWSSDKNLARYYNSATTFYTPSLDNPPAALQYLLKDGVKQPSGCTVSASSDVPNCVKVGTMPTAGFDARSSSAAGAVLAMQRTSGSTQNVDLLTDTLTYLHGKNAWSAIRDGSGNSAHTEGVVEWTGSGIPTECYFSGKDELAKAITGAHTNSLSNMMAKQYPNLYWTMSDVYGYCDAGHPVLVFLMRQQTKYLNRTLDTAGGVVEVRGSASGAPVFTHLTKPDNLPGPSYPMTVADDQLQANTWAAGRSFKDHGLFGFATDDKGDGDFQLQSKTDGHTYWVTPLTLTSSQSQLFIAYAMVRADQVTAGQLNPMSIYVLAADSIQRINIDSLEASAKDYLSQQVPGFFSSGGQLVNYTPTSGDVWRAFAEINGRVVYRLDLSASNAIQPVLVSLENFGGTSPAAQNANAACGTPVAQLSQAQIAACLKAFAGALS
jgi:hypothetical protein